VGAKVPPGSRHKGYEEIVVQDLNLSPQVTWYRRERWMTPEGETIIAALDRGIVGGYGPNLHRLVLALHFSGQVTCERIVALLNGMGVMISKRQVVRLLTAKLDIFRAEDEAVLKVGLSGAYVTVDDTGARHARKSGYTTQIGSDRFTVFRTGPSKSRQALSHPQEAPETAGLRIHAEALKSLKRFSGSNRSGGITPRCPFPMFTERSWTCSTIPRSAEAFSRFRIA
jgi:hypothetical protein